MSYLHPLRRSVQHCELLAWECDLLNNHIEKSIVNEGQLVLYYLKDGQKRCFVREALMIVPKNRVASYYRVVIKCKFWDIDDFSSLLEVHRTNLRKWLNSEVYPGSNDICQKSKRCHKIIRKILLNHFFWFW